MRKTIRFGTLGLLALACGASLFATTLTLTGTVMNVNSGGGEYTANLSSPPVTGLDIYCVDFINTASMATPYNVTLSTIGGSTFAADTNYGGDAASAFTYYTGTYTASQRYLMAGWLATQYNVALGGSNANNQGIQSAIWDLLDTNGSTHTAGNYSTWLSNATTWETGASPSTLAAFTNGITIYDGTYSATDCTPQKMQEFISLNVANVPEPGTLVTLGFGLGMIGLGALRRRRNT